MKGDQKQTWLLMYDLAGDLETSPSWDDIAYLEEGLRELGAIELRKLAKEVGVTPASKGKDATVFALVERIRDLKHTVDATRPGFAGF